MLTAPGKLDSEPPLLVVQPTGSVEVTKPIPVQVATLDGGTTGMPQHIGEPSTMLDEQVMKGFRGEGLFHGLECPMR